MRELQKGKRGVGVLCGSVCVCVKVGCRCGQKKRKKENESGCGT